MPAKARRGSRHSLGLTSALSRDHVGPKRLKLLSLQEIAPRRHLVLAARHGADEALVLLMRKLAKIKRGLGILHARAMTWRAIARVDGGSELDLLRVKAGVLGGRGFCG